MRLSRQISSSVVGSARISLTRLLSRNEGRSAPAGSGYRRGLDAPKPERGLGLVRRQRPAQEEALHLLASEAAQGGQLLRTLDALGDDGETQRVPELDDRPEEHVALRVATGTIDEHLVDLQHVDGEGPQVVERRVAGTEVVDGEEHAEVLQAVEALEQLRSGWREHALGDLEDERRRRETRRRQGVSDIADDVAVQQLPARQVDVDGHRTELVLPARDLGTRGAEDGPTDLDDHARLLGE